MLFKLWSDSCLSCPVHFSGHIVLLASTTLNTVPDYFEVESLM